MEMPSWNKDVLHHRKKKEKEKKKVGQQELKIRHYEFMSE
jgi:hypothetical protein